MTVSDFFGFTKQLSISAECSFFQQFLSVFKIVLSAINNEALPCCYCCQIACVSTVGAGCIPLIATSTREGHVVVWDLRDQLKVQNISATRDQ